MKSILSILFILLSLNSFSQQATTTNFNDVYVSSKDQSVSVTVFWKQNAIRVITRINGKTDTAWLPRLDLKGNAQIPKSADTSLFQSHQKQQRLLDSLNYSNFYQYYITLDYKSYLK
jgi:hypothetical protein